MNLRNAPISIPFLALIVFIAVSVTFARSAWHSFVSVDDIEYVVNNEHMRDGFTRSNVRWALTAVGYSANWHPLAWISLMADVSLAGRIDDDSWNREDNRVAYIMHRHNILLHSLNAALLFYLLYVIVHKYSGCFGEISEMSTWMPNLMLGCALLSVIWGVHPLRCEVVCWVSERKELVSNFFMLLVLIVYISKSSVYNYFISLILFALALMAKPVAVTLPVVIMAWEWVIMRKSFVKTFVKCVPFGLLSGCCCFLTMLSQEDALACGETVRFVGRMSSIFRSPLVYAWQTIFPVGLSFCYGDSTVMCNGGAVTVWIQIVMGVVLVAAMMWICFHWLKHRNPCLREIVFGLSWVYVGLLPMLGLIKVGSEEHSDRYTYWVGCGVCVTIAMIVCHLQKSARVIIVLRKFHPSIIKAMVCILVILVGLTWVRQDVWQNSENLYRDALPKSWCGTAVSGLVEKLVMKGKEGRAESMFWLRETLAHYRSIAACGTMALFLATEPTFVSLTDDGEDPYSEVRYWAEQAFSGQNKAGHICALKALAIVDMRSEKWQDAICNLKRLKELGGVHIDAWVDENMQRCNEKLLEKKNMMTFH